jgi:hypothetical protein
MPLKPICWILPVAALCFLGAKDPNSHLAPGSRANPAAGWKAFVDPETGRILDGPQPAPAQIAGPQAVAPAANATVGNRTPGFRELPGKTKAGGVKVDLADGFFHYLKVESAADGTPGLRCDLDPGLTAISRTIPDANR